MFQTPPRARRSRADLARPRLTPAHPRVLQVFVVDVNPHAYAPDAGSTTEADVVVDTEEVSQRTGTFAEALSDAGATIGFAQGEWPSLLVDPPVPDPASFDFDRPAIGFVPLSIDPAPAGFAPLPFDFGPPPAGPAPPLLGPPPAGPAPLDPRPRVRVERAARQTGGRAALDTSTVPMRAEVPSVGEKRKADGLAEAPDDVAIGEKPSPCAPCPRDAQTFATLVATLKENPVLLTLVQGAIVHAESRKEELDTERRVRAEIGAKLADFQTEMHEHFYYARYLMAQETAMALLDELKRLVG